MNLDGFRGGDHGLAQLNNEAAANNADQRGCPPIGMAPSRAADARQGPRRHHRGAQRQQLVRYYQDGSDEEVAKVDALVCGELVRPPEMAAASSASIPVPGDMQFSTEELTAFVQKR